MKNIPSSQRQYRFAELIRSLISECFLREDIFAPDNNTSITVTFVKMSKDLKIANVYFMPLGGQNKDHILENINSKKYLFQKYLSQAKLKSKFTPKLNFFLDETFDEVAKIEKLLSNK